MYPVIRLARRQLLLGAAVGLPLYANFGSVSFGLNLGAIDAIGKVIAESFKIFSGVTKDVSEAYDNSVDIIDKYHSRKIANKLWVILQEMSDVNVQKTGLIYAFQEYLAKDTFAPEWSEIQHACAQTSESISYLLDDIGENNEAFLKGTGFATAGDLKVALAQQASIYAKLSKLEAPTTDEERSELLTVVTKLNELLKSVVDFETKIEAYLQKFAPN